MSNETTPVDLEKILLDCELHSFEVETIVTQKFLNGGIEIVTNALAAKEYKTRIKLRSPQFSGPMPEELFYKGQRYLMIGYLGFAIDRTFHYESTYAVETEVINGASAQEWNDRINQRANYTLPLSVKP